MSDSYMIQAGLTFKFHFINSMVDEKRNRADGGLQGSGSLYMCDLCKATHETAKTELGTFRIYRNLQETKEIAELLRTNPEKLSDAHLKQIAQGVKSAPLSSIEHSEHSIDATHADINMGRFLKKLIVREIAGVSQ